MRVLIVEDELRMASLIRRGLLAEGLAADVAPNGEDALWMAQAHGYDAIVLDAMLPGIDRFETCRRPRAGDFASETGWTVVEVYTRPARRKMDEPFGRQSLETVRGVGYRLRADGA